MILKDYYWYFKSAIDPDICDKIVEIGKSHTPEQGLINTNSPENNIQEILKKRNSNVSWLEDQWIYGLLQSYVTTANKSAGWNFQWDWSEPMQFTIYNPGQYYGWHPDQNENVYECDGPKKGKCRKISVTLSLNDSDEYEGGELEFDFGQGIKKVCSEIRPKGSIVVFPSFVYHRVRPVNSGTRYSLVMWSVGDPYR